MNNEIKAKGKGIRWGSIVIAISLAALLLFQFWFTGFSEKKQLYVDLTSEGLYTMTDKMVEELSYLSKMEVEKPEDGIVITFCAEPDELRSNARARTVYFMSLALQKVFPAVTVKTVNLRSNPTAVNAYKTTSLSVIEATDVIIAHKGSFRIAPINAFWTTNSEDELFSYNGEFKMATLFHSLTNRKSPKAYFVTNHEETYYDPKNEDHPDNKKMLSLYTILLERGLTVDTLDLSDKDVPEDCALLIINNPRIDYSYDSSSAGSYAYVSETEKLERYLTRNQGSLMVAKDYKLPLQNLEDFLFEWGFILGDEQLSDEGSYLTNAEGTYTDLIGKYETEENTYAYAIYGSFASLSSSPRMVISDAGEIRCAYDLGTGQPEAGSNNISRYYAPFFTTSDQGKLVDENGLVASAPAVRDICSIALRYGVDPTSLAHSYSYIFCANSASFFSEETLGNHSFANFDVTGALIENIAREDVYASMDLGGSSLNSSSYGGKRLHSAAIATTTTNIYNNDGSVRRTNEPITSGAQTAIIIVALALPLCITVAGFVIHLRRRFR